MEDITLWNLLKIKGVFLAYVAAFMGNLNYFYNIGFVAQHMRTQYKLDIIQVGYSFMG